ncbi:MAG: aminotransferase [Bdellovibrionales bacterium GWB1_52_6]|nr:MAG: aminotransferase [Bdellovibrionales bacterium GWB1_52_6]OFZ05477.1 MAG: aminotransferase [Bdellovibrionales bacterium GWA1_52_35]HCM39157.1 aminotransferase [Bdellovibrionales bacterium]
MKKIIPAARTEKIKYAVRDILLIADQAKAAGKKLVYLNIGDPVPFGFRTPEFITDAIIDSLRRGETGYAPSAGTAPAVEAIRRDGERRGIQNIQDIYVTSGGSEAIELAMTALLNPGDDLLVPCPGYPLYTAVLEKLGAVANPYYLDEEDGWQIDVEDVRRRITPKTRGIVVINPNNPTGSVLSEKVAQQLVDLAEEHDLVLFSDEIYDKLIFDDVKHVSLAALSKDVAAITFNGLSKVYVGPGLRMGWGVVSGPEAKIGDYYRAIQKLTRARLCAPHPVMAAVPIALDGKNEHLPEVVAQLKLRRDITVEMLANIPGISCVKPQGAFYAFPKIDGFKDSDEEWCARLIREKGVVTVPGSGFGQRPGTKHFRIVFLPDEPTLRQAYSKISEFMKELKQS